MTSVEQGVMAWGLVALVEVPGNGETCDTV